MVKLAIALGLMFALWAPNVLASDLRIGETIRTYSVTGNSIQAVVKSMKRNGPMSQLHGRRALGMADYRYRTKVKTKKSNGVCRVMNATVSMQIYLTLPRLSSRARLNRRDASKWRRISSMIERHERHHARLYRRFANDLRRALLRMKPQRNCHDFRRLERQLTERLENLSKRRNRNFDRAQYRPFNRRLKRLAPKRN